MSASRQKSWWCPHRRLEPADGLRCADCGRRWRPGRLPRRLARRVVVLGLARLAAGRAS